ncbi:fungal-specific transcription factor domain protein [Xylariaceae sp. FL1019]|nr:fungal-specific transcription factor domain protein [Xylariaceae sp. FL1019]
MEADMAEIDGSGSPPPFTRRACDQCRLRKIRCDKETPCSNCRSARRSCSSTGAGQKPKEVRQRVLISSQYERKIDQIEDRLGGIEALLQQLISNTNTNSASIPSTEPFVPQRAETARSQTQSATPSSSTLDKGPRTGRASSNAEKTIFDPEGSDTFEGNSSLAAHTAFASEFLADAVRKTTLRDGGAVNPKFEAALNSLRQIVDMQNKPSRAGVWNFGDSPPDSESERESELGWGPTQKPIGKTNLQDLPLPPMALVREQLSEMQHGPVPAMLAILYQFVDFESFADRCRRLYFKTEDPSDGRFILVNSGLIYVFFEASLSASDPVKKASYDDCRIMCQHNVEIALAQLPLFLPATAENIEALLMGASFCIDISRASLAWILVSRAAHMCRTLGYHQMLTMKDDPTETKASKSLLFWCTYMLDKALSLRLGRASVLQDYDISLPHVTPESKADYPGKEVMTLWIQHAQILGRIYERLYSPGALRQPETTRTEQVARLAAEQTRLMKETLALFHEFEHSPDGEGRMFALTLKSDVVSFLASLALTYRALPPNGARSRTFADECIDMARASMRCHHEAISLMRDKSLQIVYIHWTILYAPFIPFIVIFCLVIETSDAEDLNRLREFVRSLEPATDMSSSVRKLHQLCQVLCNVAELYVEAKGNGGQEMGNEFDLYLSQLGFMPDVGMGGMGVDGLDGMGQGNTLEDWFSGKNYMMGLLEEDLSGINPNGWPS